MIRPRPRGRQWAPRLGAAVLTVALLLGAAAGLRATSLPEFASGRAVIRQLDALILERFAFIQPDEPAVEEEVESLPEPSAEDVSFDDEVGAAMAGLEELFAGEDEVTTPAGARGEDEPGDRVVGIESTPDDARFESLFGSRDDTPVGRVGRGPRSPAREGAGGLGIGINERVAEPVTDSSAATTPAAAGPDVTVRTATEREAVEAPTVAIFEYAAESFDLSEADRLGAWMRANPAPLPVGVQVHMNHEPTFLTSAVPFDTDDGRWELYLMFNESIREIHIVLVDGDRSVYLIDRGFQEQSRSLREGTVRRSGGRIVAVDSRSGSASSERAREFYNVFLSWWETAKADVAGS